MNYTILDASNDFAELSNNIARFKRELCKKFNIDFGSQDFRLVTLDTIQQYLLSLTAYIRAFVELQNRVSPDKFLKILNIGSKTKEEIEASRIIYKFPIESLVTMIHFDIDSFLGKICDLKGNSQRGFFKRMQAVLCMIEIDNKQKKNYRNTLQCLSFFRNSFHNSGLHLIHKKNWENGIEPKKGKKDRMFGSEGLTIEFNHKQAIDNNWKSAYLLIKESVEVLKEVVKLWTNFSLI